MTSARGGAGGRGMIYSNIMFVYYTIQLYVYIYTHIYTYIITTYIYIYIYIHTQYNYINIIVCLFNISNVSTLYASLLHNTMTCCTI